MDCARQTVMKEGFFVFYLKILVNYLIFKALYKGMAAPLVGVSPLFAVFFGGTAMGKWLLQKDPNQKLSFAQNFTAGFFLIFYLLKLLFKVQLLVFLQLQ